jgi:predicted MFS family arabinose efflux permease
MKTSSKIGLLASLYLSQGLPYGFFTQALPALLRHQQVSLSLIGLTSLLSVTWAVKFLWAPLIDLWGSNRFGYRKSWIVPLQLWAALLLLCTALLDPKQALVVVVCIAFAANVLAATQDVATDALAIDVLSPAERGMGNGVQIAGYRVGMILGGGILLIIFDRVGWETTFTALGGMLLLGVLPVSLHQEPRRVVTPGTTRLPQHYMPMLLGAFRQPYMGAWLLVLLTYKAGDALGSAMLRPFLVDRGLSLAAIGWMLGTVGFTAGLLGAVVGGGVINLLGRDRGLVVFGLLHALSMALYALPAAGIGTEAFLYGVCAAEHFAGSLASVALCTQMMDRSRADASATDYTVQSSTLAVAIGVVGATSGLVAEAVGYTILFVLASVIGLAGVIVWMVIGKIHQRVWLTTFSTEERFHP